MELTIILGVICQVINSHELTVKGDDLKRCDGAPVCVTDKEHCYPLPENQDARTQVNLTCYYEQSSSPGSLTSPTAQVSCDWSPASPGSSLVFTSLSELWSCSGILWEFGRVNVMVRVHDQEVGVVRWSVPHTLNLSSIVRGSQPEVVFSGFSSSSLDLSWTPKNSDVCQVRYAAELGPGTTQEEQIRVERRHQVVYTLQELLPSTLYSARVACRPDSGSWGFWSAECKGRTLERAPSAAPDVCYRLERRRESPGAPPLFLLWLMWTELDVRQVGGRIQGYQVSYYSSANEAQATVNVTRLTALLKVKEEHCRVTVTAFNSMGFGPTRPLNTEPHQSLPLPRHLWAFSLYPDHVGFLVQWEMDSVSHAPATALGPPTYQGASSPAFPVSQFAVEWRSEGIDSVSGWTRVDNTSAVIQGDLDRGQIYKITVHPVHGHLCGPTRSLTASLQHGALLEVINLRAVDVNKTTITAQWVWQRKTEPIRVERYKVVLRCNCDSEDQALLLFPDQSQHTFQNLIPNNEYSLLLLADNITRGDHIFRTPFDVSTATLVSSVILLAVTMFLCFLSRAAYKYYFVTRISSPRRSSTGLWLMDKHQRALVRNILNIEDFLVTDVLGDKHPIKVAAGALEASQCTNTHPAGLGMLPPSQEYVATAQVVAVSSVYINDSVLFQSPDYIANSPVAMEALSDKMQPLIQPPHHHSHCFFPQEEEVTSELSRFHNPEVFNLCLGEGLHLPGGRPMVCERDYVLSSNFTETSPLGSSCIRVTGAEVQ
ncbi:unnamed protein product [Lota lota]